MSSKTSKTGSTSKTVTAKKASAVTVKKAREFSAEEKKNLAIAHTLTSEARVAGRQASILGARAVQAATPFVGKVPEWSTWADYAREVGVDAKAGIARLKGMARALDLGIDPETDGDLWSGISSLANVKEVRAALNDEKATRTKVDRAVKAAKRAKASTGTRAASTAKAGKEADTKQVEMPRNVSGLLDLLDTITARLTTSTITPAEHKRLAAIVESLGEVKVTAKVA